ncbi:Zinc finger C2H2 LYAR-type domain-containing protein [Plasmodiophora brassicae]|uniref:Zinc finger C2H2 LYAR-type domain-containing protein n=2 Tax=Plasmodiophora brassicae TaxID=37360 RepID=A0A3P3YAN5_PLABS|nr:unnamed protein product [Plasmodiophora brassicae]
MVSFSCDGCNETLKKQKVAKHFCGSRSVSCIDCSKTFYDDEYAAHTSCISEAAKYEKSLYRGPRAKQNTAQKKPTPAEYASAEPKQEAVKPASPVTSESDVKPGEKKRKREPEPAKETAQVDRSAVISEAVDSVLNENPGEAFLLKRLRRLVKNKLRSQQVDVATLDEIAMAICRNPNVTVSRRSSQ